jgi:hypothetical protein
VVRWLFDDAADAAVEADTIAKSDEISLGHL